MQTKYNRDKENQSAELGEARVRRQASQNIHGIPVWLIIPSLKAGKQIGKDMSWTTFTPSLLGQPTEPTYLEKSCWDSSEPPGSGNMFRTALFSSTGTHFSFQLKGCPWDIIYGLLTIIRKILTLSGKNWTSSIKLYHLIYSFLGCINLPTSAKHVNDLLHALLCLINDGKSDQWVGMRPPKFY